MPKTIQPKEYVLTQEELADQLGVSRRTIARMMKLDAHPDKTDDGQYDVNQWREFREQYMDDVASATSFPKEIKEELAKIRLRRDTAIAQREELILAKMKREIVSLSYVQSLWRDGYAIQCRLMREAFQAIDKISYGEAEERYHQLLKDIGSAMDKFIKEKDKEDEESNGKN